MLLLSTDKKKRCES